MGAGAILGEEEELVSTEEVEAGLIEEECATGEEKIGGAVGVGTDAGGEGEETSVEGDKED